MTLLQAATAQAQQSQEAPLPPRSTAVETVSTVPTGGPPGAVIEMVRLRDGTLLRGYVTEIRPTPSVTMQLLDGRIREISWSEIVSAEGPSFRFAPPPNNGSQLQTSRLLIESAGDNQRIGVLVGTIESSYRGHVGGLYRDLCTTPCMIEVPPGEIELTAQRTALSRSYFVVNVPRAGLRVRLHAPHDVIRAFASIGMALGIGVSVLSGAFVLAAYDNVGAFAVMMPALGVTALSIAGLVATPGGVESAGPLPIAPPANPWSVGAAPTQGGAVAIATVRF